MITRLYLDDLNFSYIRLYEIFTEKKVILCQAPSFWCWFYQIVVCANILPLTNLILSFVWVQYFSFSNLILS